MKKLCVRVHSADAEDAELVSPVWLWEHIHTNGFHQWLRRPQLRLRYAVGLVALMSAAVLAASLIVAVVDY